MWIIYKHTNKINGKSYIGQTIKSIDERAGRDGKNYEGSNEFYGAIKEYGWDNFEHTILQENIATQEEADTQERYWIKYYDTFKHGYNLTLGGSRARFTLFKTREYKKQLKTIQISKELLDFIKEYAAKDIVMVDSIKEFIYGYPNKQTIYMKESPKECKFVIRLLALEGIAKIMRDGGWYIDTEPVSITTCPYKSRLAYQVIAYYKNDSSLRGIETQEVPSIKEN